MRNTLEFGLGWLRAVAQGYNYSYNKIILESTFQLNLISFETKLNWGSDGCARWRKVTLTIAITIKLNSEVMFKIISRMLQSNAIGAWMAARGGARLQLQLTKIELWNKKLVGAWIAARGCARLHLQLQ